MTLGPQWRTRPRSAYPTARLASIRGVPNHLPFRGLNLAGGSAIMRRSTHFQSQLQDCGVMVKFDTRINLPSSIPRLAKIRLMKAGA